MVEKENTNSPKTFSYYNRTVWIFDTAPSRSTSSETTGANDFRKANNTRPALENVIDCYACPVFFDHSVMVDLSITLNDMDSIDNTPICDESWLAEVDAANTE